MKATLPMNCIRVVTLLSSLVFASSLYSEEMQMGWNRDVLRLFSLEERDQALQKILKRAYYPKNPAYKEKNVEQIKEVVVCPQPGNKPLIAVFARSVLEHNDESPRSGHLVIIRNDGMLIPFYSGANSVDGHFCDLNGDGVMDCIQSWLNCYKGGELTGLYVVPVLEKMKPSLMILWRKDELQWRLHQPDLRRLPSIQLGTVLDFVFTVAAEYSWSSDEKRWVGPKGSPEEGFVVVNDDEKRVVSQLLKAKSK